MAPPLLTTKLHLPAAPAGTIHRPHLFRRLDQGLAAKLTLVSAPAGFGKTTLLSAWLRRSDMPFAWLSLDEADNDIARFLSYVIAALRGMEMPVEEDLPSLLQSSQPARIETALTPLVNQIAQSEGRQLLVLDDYHLIDNQDIHEALGFILNHQPPSLHLVIATRADPPFPLARLRASREMLEIRQSDLRFSLEEGERLLNQSQGLSLSPEDLQALVERTEGWVAGLHLAALALKDRGDASDYIRRFAGSQDTVAAYLSDEVLRGQPEPVQDFLLKTSILDRFSAPLCDRVAGQGDSRRTLAQLRAANLFVIPLDETGEWYRYHHLFADLLHRRLLVLHPQIIPELYANASRWFEGNGTPDEAIEYALRGGDSTRALRLIDGAAEETLGRSEITVFMRWVERLPEDMLNNEASLAIFYAWALLVSGKKVHVARSILGQVTVQDDQTRGRLEAVKAMLAMYARQTPKAVELASLALEMLPEGDLFFRNLAAWNLSAALYISGDHAQGEKVLEELAQASIESENLLVAIVALCRLGTIQKQLGNLYRSFDIYEQALRLAKTAQAGLPPAACEALIGLGVIHWEWHAPVTAKDLLLEGIELSKRWKGQAAIEAYIALAQIAQWQGDFMLADEMIAQATSLALQSIATEADDRYVASQRICLLIWRGDLETAKNWALESRLAEHAGAEPPDPQASPGAALMYHYERIVYARLLLAQGRPDEALEILKDALLAMERMGFMGKVIETQILRSIGLQAQGRAMQAVSALANALHLAQPDRHIRPFLIEGRPVARLLERVAEAETSPLLERLLAAQPEATSRDELIEPLSQRELEVLRLLATDLNVAEIADRLYIALSTARSHIKSIYAKLGAHSRYEAVDKARDLDFL